MSDAFQRLLDATIDHLERLREQGARQVPVAPETLAALRQAPVRPNTKKHAPTPSGLPVAERVAARPALVGGEASPLNPTSVSPSLPSGTPDGPGGRLPLDPNRVPAPGQTTAALRALQARVQSCTKCPHLADSRRNVVFGVGNPEARLMFVGEAPGADEDLQGEPFVGRAGQLLTRIIQAMGLERSQVYIGNVLKCRPDTPGQAAGNRKPTPTEMITCLPYLEEQIGIIRPEVLVALGLTAVEGLLGKQAAATPMGRMRGRWLEFRGIPLMVTYHPAYLLRNQHLGEKRKVWEDMLLVMERLGLPISEKQRGFFLKAMGQ